MFIFRLSLCTAVPVLGLACCTVTTVPGLACCTVVTCFRQSLLVTRGVYLTNFCKISAKRFANILKTAEPFFLWVQQLSLPAFILRYYTVANAGNALYSIYQLEQGPQTRGPHPHVARDGILWGPRYVLGIFI